MTVARQGGKRLESLAGTSHGAVAPGFFVAGQKISDIDAENTREFLELFEGQSDITTLPGGIGRLGNAESGGNFALGKVGLFAEGLETFTEGGTAVFGWATCFGHVVMIAPANNKYRFSLHVIDISYHTVTMKKVVFALDGFFANSATLTAAQPNQTGLSAEQIAHLERDRWPEFKRELNRRRPRKFYFDIHHYGMERQDWEWMVGRSRSWSEVERVLNQHRVDWTRANRHEVLVNGATIYRMR